MRLKLNKVSEDLEELLDELERYGFSELPKGKIPSIDKSRVFASTDGDIATILKVNDSYSLVYRDIKPVDKGAGKREYRVNIDGKSISCHLIVGLTYPSFCGIYAKGKTEWHHIDGNHLNNACVNLISLTKKEHKLVHSLMNISEGMKDKVIKHLQEHIAFNNEISVERLEELIYEEV